MEAFNDYLFQWFMALDALCSLQSHSIVQIDLNMVLVIIPGPIVPLEPD